MNDLGINVLRVHRVLAVLLAVKLIGVRCAAEKGCSREMSTFQTLLHRTKVEIKAIGGDLDR